MIVKTVKYFLLIMLVAAINASMYATAQTIAQTDQTQKKIIKNITPEQGYELIIINTENPNFVILDVRTPQEFEKVHINRAINIDYLSETFKDKLGELDKKNTYVIHCRSGGRSTKALKLMDELGFEEVYNMGGIVQWEESGYPTVK